MGIQRYMFFSIYNCDKYPEVPLMNIKSCTEKFLESSGLNHTTFRLCGFHQVRTVQGHACAAHTQRRAHACQKTVVTLPPVPLRHDCLWAKVTLYTLRSKLTHECLCCWTAGRL